MIDRNRVAVIVLNWCAADDTLACLKSLHELSQAPGRIVVIDNASTDDSVERIRSAYPAIELVINTRNEGYGRGQNPTIQTLLEQDVDWIWLLNNDAIVKPDSLRILLEHAAKQPNAGAIGMPIHELDQPEQLQAWGGGKVSYWLGRSAQFQQPVADHELDYLTGASLLLRTEALNQTGLFDPQFFMYWEDVDLSTRLIKKGWALTVAKAARVLHRGSGSMLDQAALKDQMMNESAVQFFRKHGPLGGWPAILIGITGRVGKRIVTRRWSQAAAVLRGAFKGLRKR